MHGNRRVVRAIRAIFPVGEHNPSQPRGLRSRPVASFLAIAALATCASAEWRPDFVPEGPSGEVRALVVFDGELALGGTFTWCGGARARHVGRWTGDGWSGYGSGVPFATSALAVHDGRLVAAGTAIVAGDPAIARWMPEANAWEPLGELDGVSALATHEGALVAGGWFAGAHAILRRDGEAWRPLDGLGGRARALAVHRGRLVAGGDFPGHVAEWDGAVWRVVGEGLDGPVHALLAHEGRLLAGGDFDRAGRTAVRHVAAWHEGRWQSVGGGLDDVVRALGTLRDDVIAGGWFRPDSEGPLRHVARLTDGAWRAMGRGAPTPVLALASYRDLLAAGCTVASGQDAADATHLAVSRGAAFGALGGGAPLDERVHALAPSPDGLYVAGYFTRAGERAARRVARWDGSRWHPLGDGVNDHVFALAIVEGGVVAGGAFTEAGGAPVPRIARWTGSRWAPLGAGLDGEVMCVALFEGHVVAGGQFTRSGTDVVTHLARFRDGAWEPFGGGADAPVYALAVADGSLIVGGEFTRLGGEDLRFLARRHGDRWHAMGDALDGPVFALARDSRERSPDGAILIGGTFTRAGPRPLEFVASWNGATLEPVATGLSARVSEGRPYVQAIAVHDDAVVVAGDYLMVLQDGTWSDLGGGVRGRVGALAVHGGTLYVGGSFESVGTLRSPNLAAWR